MIKKSPFIPLCQRGRQKLTHSITRRPKVYFGPGYRIYFGRRGSNLIILLGAGNKRTQSEDIIKAHTAWQDYKTDCKLKG